MHRLVVFALTAVALCISAFVPRELLARDDGRFANSPLKSWFDKLASGKGLCCSFADGVSIEDIDWDTQDGGYRVRLNGKWIAVPEVAVVVEPMGFGPAGGLALPGRFRADPDSMLHAGGGRLIVGSAGRACKAGE